MCVLLFVVMIYIWREGGYCYLSILRYNDELCICTLLTDVDCITKAGYTRCIRPDADRDGSCAGPVGGNVCHVHTDWAAHSCYLRALPCSPTQGKIQYTYSNRHHVA